MLATVANQARQQLADGAWRSQRRASELSVSKFDERPLRRDHARSSLSSGLDRPAMAAVILLWRLKSAALSPSTAVSSPSTSPFSSRGHAATATGRFC